MPSPSTCRLRQAVLARVGPRSGPPCFLLPPTIVGAMAPARLAQAAAPGQPPSAIRSARTAPTVGTGPVAGAGQRNQPAHGG